MRCWTPEQCTLYISEEEAKHLGLKATRERDTMKAVNSPTKPIASTTQSMHVLIRMWSKKLDFFIKPMDDFRMVLGMKFFNQVYAFLLQATNSFIIFEMSKECMVLAKRTKPDEKTLSTMQFKKALKKDQSFLVSIRSSTREKIMKILQVMSPYKSKMSLTSLRTTTRKQSIDDKQFMTDYRYIIKLRQNCDRIFNLS